MSSKVISQTHITDTFTQQKSGTSKSKDRGKKTFGSPIKQSKPEDEQATTADEILRKEELNLLREFDLDWKFGPCAGITRLERWERAASHGHNPPQRIKDMIVEHKDDREYVQNIWSGYPL